MKQFKGGGNWSRVQATGWGKVGDSTTPKASTWIWVGASHRIRELERILTYLDMLAMELMLCLF